MPVEGGQVVGRCAARALLVALVLGVGGHDAGAQPTEVTKGAGLHGAGDIELRLQTATELPIGGQLTFAAAPGFAYAPKERELLVNVVGGAGYFLTPAFALGLDASYTGVEDELTLVTIAPFAKLMSKLERWSLGWFAELSPGLILVKLPGERFTYVQLSAWGGAHVPITDSAALVVGPTVTGLVRTDKPGPNELLFGQRIGLNIFLASRAPPPDERPNLGRGTFELRFQTGSHAMTGGVLSPQSSQSLTYGLDNHELFANAIGGGGVFLSNAFAFGAELSSALSLDTRGGDTARLVGLGAFAKLVSGMAAWRPGAFFEASPGLLLVELGNLNSQRQRVGALSQLSVWAGAHLPVGTTTAFVIGPTATRYDDVKDFGEGAFLVGARLGMSLYMPSRRKQ